MGEIRQMLWCMYVSRSSEAIVSIASRFSKEYQHAAFLLLQYSLPDLEGSYLAAMMTMARQSGARTRSAGCA